MDTFEEYASGVVFENMRNTRKLADRANELEKIVAIQQASFKETVAVLRLLTEWRAEIQKGL